MTRGVTGAGGKRRGRKECRRGQKGRARVRREHGVVRDRGDENNNLLNEKGGGGKMEGENEGREMGIKNRG